MLLSYRSFFFWDTPKKTASVFLVNALGSLYFLQNHIYIAFSISCSLVVLFWIFLRERGGKIPVFILPIMIVYFLFLLVCLLSAVLSDYSYLSVQRVIINFVPVLSLLFSFFWVKDVLAVLEMVAKIIVFFTVFLVFMSLFLIFFGGLTFKDDVGTVLFYDFGVFSIEQVKMGTGIARLGSLVGNPNGFGLWVFMGLTSLLYLGRIGCFSRKKFFSFAVFMILGFALSLSRSSIGAAFIFLLVFYGASFFLWRRTLDFLGVVFCVFFLVFLGGVVFGFGGEVLGNRAGLSLNARGVAWEIGEGLFYDNPFLGVGFGVSNEAIIDAAYIELAMHSVYMQIISEVGLVGFSMYVLTMVMPIGCTISGLLKGKSRRVCDAFLFCFAFLISFSVHQTVENSSYRGGFYMIIWFFFTVFPFFLYAKEVKNSSH